MPQFDLAEIKGLSITIDQIDFLFLKKVETLITIITVSETSSTLPSCENCFRITLYKITVEIPHYNQRISYRTCRECFLEAVGSFRADMIAALLNKKRKDQQTDILLKGIHKLQDRRRKRG